MNKQKFICKKCGNTEYIVKEKPNGTGIATGLYCAKCGTWQKWLNKQEKVLYNSEPVGKQDDEQETKIKIAQILAEQLCPNKNAHFASWGSAANCYSRMNFAECEKMADATDALIAENIGDTSELFGKIEQLKAENAELRARLDKAVELPFKPDKIDIGSTKFVKSVTDISVMIEIPLFIYKKEKDLDSALAYIMERKVEEL